MLINSNQKAIFNNVLNNQKIIILGFALVILVLLGGIFLLSFKKNEVVTPTVILKKTVVTPTPIQGETIMVTFTRFVPSILTVKQGKEINFVNFSGKDIDIESDETKELKIGLMKDNDTSNPIKLSPGTYKYYDKLNPKITGEIIVTN